MASIVVIGLVLLLDILAFVLAIGAERRRSTAQLGEAEPGGRQYCVYDTDASTWYGVGALVLLLVGQAVAMAASRCFCCGRALSPGRWRFFSGLFFVLCWLTFVIAEVCLLAGSVRNAYHTKYVSRYYDGGALPCAMLRRGVFAAGAAFAFLTTLFVMLHYVFYSKARAAPPPIINGGGIGMTRI